MEECYLSFYLVYAHKIIIKKKKQRMSRISKITQRQNYHIDNTNSNIPLVHIFSTNKNNKMIQSLRKELNNKSYSYQDHQDFRQFQSLIPFNKNAIVIISSDDADQFANIPKQYNWSQDRFAKFYSFPRPLKDIEMPNLQDGKQLIAIIQPKNGGGGSTKIKLASVHSIKVSKDKKIESSKSIKKINTQSTYEKIFYLRDQNQYQNSLEFSYPNIIAELEREANFYSFKTAKELQKKQTPKGNKKNIILTSTTPKSLKIINEIKRGRQNFDYLILGDLDPNQKLLQSNVILATNNPLKLIQFLMDNGFSSFKMKCMYDKLKKGKAISMGDVVNQNNFAQAQVSKIQNNNKISTIYNTNQEKEQDHGEKKKIRKIKSPNKGRATQPQSNSQLNTNIIITKPSSQVIIENQIFRTNKQGQTIYKKASDKEGKQTVQTPNFNTKGMADNSHPQSKFDSVAPVVENQFLIKRSSGIQSKYRKNPSVIIHEMSDEYRGSNKESIMNLQPQRQKTQINQTYQVGNTQPVEQISVKKIVSKGMTYANEPQTYYVSGQTTESIKTNPHLPQSNTYSINRGNYTYGTINSNYIAASPIKVTTVTANRDTNQSNVRTYGYQSPSRVVRKEETTFPQEIIDNSQQKAKEVNRITFGSNYYSNNNPVNNQNSNNTINSIKTTPYVNTNNNYVSSYNSNLNTNTYGNRANNASSYNANNAYAQSSQSIASSNADNYISYNGNINNINNSNAVTRNIPNYSANYADYYNAPTLNYHSLNNEPSNNKIQISTGKTQTIVTSPQKATQIKSYGYNNYTSPPKVQDKGGANRMASSTLFNSEDYEQIERDGRIVYRKKVVGDSNKQYTPINYVSAKVEKGQEGSPSVRRYELSPVRRDPNPYQYVYEQKRKETPQQTHYQYGKTQANYTGKKNYQVITIPYKGEDQNLGQMIESSHKKKTNNVDQNLNKNFVTVSYRSDDRNKQSGGVRVYGSSSNYPRVQVQKTQRLQPKVEAKAEGLSPVQKSNALNESNWYSRMSQLHSDGSILRKNNIRFGIKVQKKEQKMQSNISVLDNKMVSGIFKVNDLNKKMALNRIIRGEDYIDQQKDKYIHINSKTNRFHFIIQEEMDYLVTIVKDHIANLQDKVDKFAGISSLFNCLKAETDEQAFDIGFIFAKTEQVPHINAHLIPEHYFIISIQQQQQGLLQINQAQKKIKIDELKHFSLVQKIILDSKLYQYVAYRNNKQEIEQLADKFMNSEFILQKIQTEFTTEILDCYYYQLPRLTRLYVLCDEQELPKMLQIIQAYSEINPNFSRQTCKLVCVLSNILDNDELIMNHPRVTFISNPQQIKHYRDILKYAHHAQDPHSHFLPIDNIFYYSKHKSLQEDLATHYPGRFSTFSFNQVSEVYPKIDKMNKIAARHGHQHKNYLVLHQNVNAQKIRVEYFTKIFMLGKAKVIQNKVVRVMNNLQLLQLLKK